MPEVDFFLSEFFVLAQFQNKGIGTIAAIELFGHLQGIWALGVLPDNQKALKFWRKTISSRAH